MNKFYIDYIKAIENPDRVGWNGKVWTAPQYKGYDKNQRGYGIDIVKNDSAKRLTQNRPGQWLTEGEADRLMKEHLLYVYNAALRHIEGFDNLSDKRKAALLGMLYRGDSVNKNKHIININEPDDNKFFESISNYYKSKGLNERAKNSSNFFNQLTNFLIPMKWEQWEPSMKFKKGGQIRKMQTASGGPIYLSAEDIKNGANALGSAFLRGLGYVGQGMAKVLSSPNWSGSLATNSYARNKKDIKRLKKESDSREESVAKGSVWLSPLNYGTALVTGNGLDARKGNAEVETWAPAWLAVARAAELYAGPKAVKGVKSAPRVVVNTAAKAGVKPAKAAVVAREINKGIKQNTNNGRIEVTGNYFNSPDKWYRITETPEKYGIMELGRNVTTHDAPQTHGTINGWRSSMLKAPVTKSSEGFIKRPQKIELGIRRKNGQAHGNTSLAAKGKLWGGTTSGSRLFPEGVIEGQAPSMINYGIDRTNFVLTPWEEVPNGGRVGFYTGEMPMSNLGWFLKTNRGTYTYEPIISEKRITKVGDVEIDNPLLAYRQGRNGIVDDFINSGKVRTKESHDIVDTGKSFTFDFGHEYSNPMFAQGQLNWGLPVGSNAQNTGLLTTSELLGIGNRQSRLVDHVVNGTTDIRMFPTRGRGVTGRVPISEDQLNTKNTTAYRWVPGYGYKKVIQEPSTSLAFFERKPSKLTEAEKFGLNKHDRKALSINELLALEDLALYKNSGLYRLVFRVTPDWENFGWNLDRSNPSFLLLFVKDGESMRGPWARVVLQTPTGKGILAVNPERNMAGYTSRSFPVPEGMNWAPGEANMMIDGTNGLKVILTAPRTDFFDAIVEKGSESIGEKLPNTIDKSIMKDFWINSRKALRPGTYLSGDNGHAPKGSELIEAFKKRQLHKIDIKERPLNKQFVTRTGLSPDSYSSIIRQGNRDGSLRWGEGFNKWNNSAVKNKFINEAFLKLQKGEITPEQYEDIFNNWSLNIGGRKLLWKDFNGHKIPIHPHPYIYAKKQGGKMNILEFLKKGSGIHIKKENKGKFTSYCGGKVTSECIAKGKASSNPAIRKRATFAANARKWKHKNGGVIKAQEGTKMNWGELAKIVGGIASNAMSTVSENKKLNALAKQNKLEKVNPLDYITKYLLEILENNLRSQQAARALGSTVNFNPDIDKHFAYLLASQEVARKNNEIDKQNKLLDIQTENLKTSNWMNLFGNIALTGLGYLTSNIGKKSTNVNVPPSSTSTTANTATTSNFNNYMNNITIQKQLGIV